MRAWEKIYFSFHPDVIDDLVEYQVAVRCVLLSRGDTSRMDWFRWIHHGHVGTGKKYGTGTHEQRLIQPGG